MVCQLKNNLQLKMHRLANGSYSSVPENELGNDVYGGAGQSNFRGNAFIRAGIDDDYTGLDKVYMWDHPALAKKPLRNPMPHQDVYSNGTGCSIQIARRLPKTREIMFAPVAKGGTGFGTHWQPGMPVYNEAVARLVAAMGTNPYNRFKAMFWHQGETDADNQNTNYLNNLKAIRNAMIAANFGMVESTPWIVGSIHSNGVWQDNINAALQQFATDIPSAFFVDLSDIPVQGDNVHFTAAGLQTMGDRYYEAYAAAVGL